jgi:hypothetical protein
LSAMPRVSAGPRPYQGSPHSCDRTPAVTRVGVVPANPPKSPWTIARQPTDYLPLMVIGSRELSSCLYQKRGLPPGSFGVGFSAHLECDR